jgi:NADPH2:quinone reductase
VYAPTLLRTPSTRLFDWIARGVLKVRIGGTYPLAEASRAHADMESRTTTGKLLLIP